MGIKGATGVGSHWGRILGSWRILGSRILGSDLDQRLTVDPTASAD